MVFVCSSVADPQEARDPKMEMTKAASSIQWRIQDFP